MKPGDFEILRKEVVPTKQVNVYLGIESLLMTYHEVNFFVSVEKVQPPNIKDVIFDIWYSWN